MKIISASVENFQRVEVIEIDAAGNIVEISGANGQGKSSILDAITATLGGKRHQPAEPIRRGAEEEGCRVVLDLGELVVERRWTVRSDRLVVRRTKDGSTFSRAQEKLATIVGVLAFDPMAFLGKKPAEQRATLLELVGIDLDELDRWRSEAYDDRRDAGRALRAARAQLDGAEEPAPGTPEELEDVSALTASLREVLAQQRENDATREAAAAIVASAETAGRVHAAKAQELARLRDQVARAEVELQELASAKESAEADAEMVRARVARLEDPDTETIQERIQAAERVNVEVRKRQERDRLAVAVEDAADVVKSQDDIIKSIDREKAELLQSARMPIEGLSVTDDGVLFDGLPLGQAATSMKIRVCTAIGAALNPELRIALVRSGNDLDRDTLAVFYDQCLTDGVQAWVERIEPTLPDALVIEAGRVRG
jgi:DNA repair exonuclease SbcCD ATPase subunit